MSESQTTQSMQEAAARLRWTAVIGAFFGVQAIIWAAAIVLTNNDASHAVVPDYDQKGQNWNATVAARLASEKLGWTARIQVDPAEDARGFRAVRISLRDNLQQPIDQADVEVILFHRAHAARIETLIAEQANSGEYVVPARVKYDGLWQFRLRIEKGADVFLDEQMLRLTGSSQTRPAQL